ncbi:hypothetical protein KC614_02025 [candidate division WWE3 bacterium]|uniref:DUF948 domain-containing protein n=1 Tax=candidate division WWE3 bacterium TaxID=2053526 RepID=A0A955RQS8_UNCKA|nr:hypothetical protein [candidate division WWE3 bacterium]
MDQTTQIVLLIMVVVLGATLVAVGVMVIFLIKDLRESMTKVNTILDDVSEITSNVANGSEFLEEVLEGLKDSVDAIRTYAASPFGALLGVFNMFRGMREEKGGE